MKKYGIILVLFLIPAILINAQPGPQGRGMIRDLKTKLKLTDDQVKKVRVILAENRRAADSLFEEGEEGPEEAGKAMDKLKTETDKKIEKILTADQKAKFAKMNEDHKSALSRQGPPMNGPRGMMPPGQGGFRPEMQGGCGCRGSFPPPPPPPGIGQNEGNGPADNERRPPQGREGAEISDPFDL